HEVMETEDQVASSRLYPFERRRGATLYLEKERAEEWSIHDVDTAVSIVDQSGYLFDPLGADEIVHTQAYLPAECILNRAWSLSDLGGTTLPGGEGGSQNVMSGHQKRECPLDKVNLQVPLETQQHTLIPVARLLQVKSEEPPLNWREC